jgi:hypothetical protein
MGRRRGLSRWSKFAKLAFPQARLATAPHHNIGDAACRPPYFVPYKDRNLLRHFAPFSGQFSPVLTKQECRHEFHEFSRTRNPACSAVQLVQFVSLPLLSRVSRLQTRAQRGAWRRPAGSDPGGRPGLRALRRLSASHALPGRPHSQVVEFYRRAREVLHMEHHLPDASRWRSDVARRVGIIHQGIG